VEAIQALRQEADKFGLSTQSVDTALQRFSRRVAEAQQGTGGLGKVFAQYGVSLKDASGNQKDVNTLLRDFAQVLQGIESPAERNRVAMQGFDAEGVKLGQTLAQLGMNVDDFIAKLKEQGRVIDEDAIRKGAEFARRWEEMTDRLRTSFQRMVLNVLEWADKLWAGLNTGAEGVLSKTQEQMKAFASGPELRGIRERVLELRSLIDALASGEASRPTTRRISALRKELESLTARDPLAALVNAREELAKLEEQLSRTRRAGPSQALRTRIDAQREAILLLEEEVDKTHQLNDEMKKLGKTAEQISGIEISGKWFRSESVLAGFSKVKPELQRGVSNFLRDIERDLGLTVQISSTYRTNSKNHISGNAIDLGMKEFTDAELKKLEQYWNANSYKYNFSFPVSGERPGDQLTGGSGPHWHAQLEKNATATRSATVATRGLSDAERQLQQLQAEGARIFEQTRTAAEAHVLNMNRLQQLYSAGAISLDTYNRAVAQSAETLGKVDDVQKKTAESVDNLWQQAGDSVASALSRMVEGTAKARDVIKSLVADIAQMLAKQAIAKYVTAAITPAAHGLALPGGMTLSPGVYNNPTLFKFAKGGRLGLLAEGSRPEAVLPLTRLSGGDLGVKAQAARQEVIINNYSGAPARETRRQLSDREIVEITIGEVQSAIGRGGNALSRSFETSYGLRRGR
jgi:hypothetical protein